MQELRAAAQARRANGSARGQRRERRVAVAHEGVARVGALRDGRDGESLGNLRRHILQAVHGEVDLAREHRLLELLGEEPLAADLRERRVEDLVALRRHETFLDGELGVRLAQARRDVVRLPERELTAPRADNDGVAFHLFPFPLTYRA